MPHLNVIRLASAALIWADHPLERQAAPALRDTLDGLLAEAAAPLVVDLVRVPAVDAEVVSVLASAATRAGAAGSGLELRLAGARRFTVRDATQLRNALALAYPRAA